MNKPRYSIDLIKQMAECDANYIRLLKLIPQLRAFRNKSLVKKAFFRRDSLSDSGKLKPRDHQEVGLIEMSTSTPGNKLAEFIVSDNRHGHENTVVEIRLVEAFKYTMTLDITQRPEAGKWLANPSMQVRIYHDASTAEVTAYQNHRNFQPRYRQPNQNMYQPDEKMQVNRFLGEWLTLCLHAGRCLKVPDIAFN
jgi:uncharacterized protein YqiB (DUF1249 family)